MTQQELEEAVIIVTKKWFYETFDDDTLEQMEKHGIIDHADGFSLSNIVALELNIRDLFEQNKG
jgi:hypothetical protein